LSQLIDLYKEQLWIGITKDQKESILMYRFAFTEIDEDVIASQNYEIKDAL